MLHIAAGYGKLEILKLLIEKGGDYKLKDNDGNSIFFAAVIHNELEIVKYLIENKKFGFSINDMREGNVKPIHLASSNADILMI